MVVARMASFPALQQQQAQAGHGQGQGRRLRHRRRRRVTQIEGLNVHRGIGGGPEGEDREKSNSSSTE